MRLKIILFNLSIIIFLICLIYLYIYVNYKYEGFEDPPVAGSPGEVFRPEGERKDPITYKTTESNVLNDGSTILKINPTLAELEKAGTSQDTAIPVRIIPYFNVSREANKKSSLSDGYYWVNFDDSKRNLNDILIYYTGATLNPINNSKEQYLIFTTSGSMVLRDDCICDILVIGGGGGGGASWGAGGGAGALIYKTSYNLQAGSYSINIGLGGAGGIAATTGRGHDGFNGSDTSIVNNISSTTIFLAKGGGGGGAWSADAGKTGGSSGGSSSADKIASVSTDNIPQDNDVFGNKGGNGGGVNWKGGGGGGAGSAGLNGNSTQIPNGGNGKEINITGVSTFYAGGGGGGGSFAVNNNPGNGGTGGGGNGGNSSNRKGGNGAVNTGSGGGGAYYGSNTNESSGGTGGSGVVIIRFRENISMGKKYLYCLMDKNYFGGGWMLAMRAVRGSRTFGYNSEHWTTASTLNNTVEKIKEVSTNVDLNISSIGDAIFNDYENNTSEINRYDAKFDIFNQYKTNEWMAIFYFKNKNGVILKGGDSISGGNRTAKGWIWRETNLIEADNIERTPLQLFRKRSKLDRHASLIDLRGNYGVKNAKELEKFKPVLNMPQLWSSQHGYNFYGINYDVPEYYEARMDRRGASTRWGFTWNENWEYSNNNDSNDVYGGIGLLYPGVGQSGYSAGDFIYCCNDSQGANSSIAFEWYVR